MTGPDDETPPRPLNTEQVLDRVQTDGAFVVFRGNFSTDEREVWDAAVRRGADSRGMDVAIRDTGGVVLISDGTHSQQVGQIERALFEVVTDPAVDGVTTQHPARSPRNRRAHLRLVRDVP